MKWKQLFKPHILDRGMEYYYAGCVEEIEADDEQIAAVVEGTEDYDVLINVDRGEVLDMHMSLRRERRELQAHGGGAVRLGAGRKPEKRFF